MVEREDLRLSLSLNSSTNNWLNLMPPQPHHSQLRALFTPPEKMATNIEIESSESEEEAGPSCSPNSTLFISGGKRSDEEEDGAGGSRKKLRLSKDQSAVLEESFKEHNTLNPKQKAALAKKLNLRPRQVEVWFQNRRARTKLKQTEVDCEFLKRCCENLKEENRRLQKEVHELRALKLISPQAYMQMTPPTTLILCPSCERGSTNLLVAAPKSSVTSWPPIPMQAMVVEASIQPSRD
ncbi:hypothetical protein LUZ60_014402 [Juncus effusus]|nr:hypothetical protein LUZ60_014402 [Juncus effusus]